jgi:tetratricopeptide (TPR) repeat protein
MKHAGCLFILTVIICSYPFVAFSEIKDMVKFEVAKKYYRQGTRYFNNMQYMAATEFFRKAIREYPDYYTARDHLARAYKLAGFTEAAVKEWESLLDIYPDNVAVTDKIENARFQDTVLDRSGEEQEYVVSNTYRSAASPRYHFNGPVDIAVDNEKSLYITSFSTGSLVKLDSNGKGVFSIKTSINGRLYGVDCRGNSLAVTDFRGDRVYILSGAPGTLIRELEVGPPDRPAAEMQREPDFQRTVYYIRDLIRDLETGAAAAARPSPI